MTRVLVNVVGLDPAVSGGASRIAREVGRLHSRAAREGRLEVVYAVGPRFASSFADWLGDPGATVLPVLADAEEHPVLDAWSPDLVVSPLFGGAPFDGPGRFGGAPHVVFMPDAQALDLPELFAPEDLQDRRRLYGALRHAARVVTLSEHARGRLLHHLPLDSDRVVIVPAGVAVAEGQASAAGIEGPFVLYGANDWPHKRHDLLVAAMAEVWRVRPELQLVLTGSHRPGFADDLCASHGCQRERVLDLGFVSDERLGGLYAAAEAVVFPSRYEGFGMPVVEAMAAGCPVVCAPVTSIPEVAGEAALFVRSDSPEDWARALVEDLPIERSALVERGRRQAALFSWERVREGWLEILEPLWKTSSGERDDGERPPIDLIAAELVEWARRTSLLEETAEQRLTVLDGVKQAADERLAVIEDLARRLDAERAARTARDVESPAVRGGGLLSVRRRLAKRLGR